MIELKGTKLVEIPYFLNQMGDKNKDILIVGECKGGTEGVSESILESGYKNVTTTDILESLSDSWLKQNTNWKHIPVDFIKFDESKKYDYIISISVFEHFGMFWEGKAYDIDSDLEDIILWNHDIQGILKACRLLKNKDSKLIITLPIGPYMNYQETGYPFLRYYDLQRQNLIKSKITEAGYEVDNEKFFISDDFTEWYESDSSINNPEVYKKHCNSYTPNMIWGLTLKQTNKSNKMNKIGISLGWNCGPATYGAANGLREVKANGYQTCPFDEMVSNLPGVIECIKDDFKYFMDDKYLEIKEVPFNVGGTVKGEKLVYNTKYNFYFNHESPGHGSLYLSQGWTGGINHYIDNNYALLKERYNRRVEAFRKYIQEGQNGSEIVFIVFRYNKDIEALENTLNETYPNLKYKIIVKDPPETTESVYMHHILMGVNESNAKIEIQ